MSRIYIYIYMYHISYVHWTSTDPKSFFASPSWTVVVAAVWRAPARRGAAGSNDSRADLTVPNGNKGLPSGNLTDVHGKTIGKTVV